MSARWIFEYPDVRLPMVATTLIAKWWFRYYWVSTIYLDPLSSENRAHEEFIASLRQIGKPNTNAEEGGRYVTQVFRCDKTGMRVALDRTLWEERFMDIEAAKAGHRKIVKRFA
jgi:hypothetical protein